MDSLALWLTSLPSQAPTGRLPAPPLSRLHGERAISMVSTFQLTRSTRLTLTHPTEPNRDRDGLGRGPERAGKNDPDRERRATRKFLLRLPDSVVRRLAPSVSWSLW